MASGLGRTAGWESTPAGSRGHCHWGQCQVGALTLPIQVPRVEVKGLQEGELSEVWGSGKQSPSCKAERGTRGGNESWEGGGKELGRGHCCPPPGALESSLLCMFGLGTQGPESIFTTRQMELFKREPGKSATNLLFHTMWAALVRRNSTWRIKHLHAYRAPNDHPWSSLHGREETTAPTQHKRPPPAMGMTQGPHMASRASHLSSLADTLLGSDPSPQGLRLPLSNKPFAILASREKRTQDRPSTEQVLNQYQRLLGRSQLRLYSLP